MGFSFHTVVEKHSNKPGSPNLVCILDSTLPLPHALGYSFHHAAASQHCCWPVARLAGNHGKCSFNRLKDARLGKVTLSYVAKTRFQRTAASFLKISNLQTQYSFDSKVLLCVCVCVDLGVVRAAFTLF